MIMTAKLILYVKRTNENRMNGVEEVGTEEFGEVFRKIVMRLEIFRCSYKQCLKYMLTRGGGTAI